MELPRLNGAKVANEWQPMSALMWVGPSSRCISLMALNTGRSGQPVQKFGGRAGISPIAAMAAALCASIPFARAAIASASMPAGRASARNDASALSSTSEVYSPARRQHPLAEHAGRDAGATQLHVDRLLDVVGTAFLDHEHGAFSRAELAQLLRHQRESDVEHVERNAARAVKIGEIEPRQRAQYAVSEPAEDDDADVGEIARDHLVELARADELLRGRKALLDLEPLLRIDDGRMRQPAIVEARRPGEAVLAGKGRAAVGLGLELAGDVTGADAQLHHHRSVACLGKLEAILDQARDGRQIRTRVDEPHRRFHGVGLGALLDHARALAVVLAEDDHDAADDAGGGEVR